MELAGAVGTVHGGERSLLKPGRRHDDLEHRARRVLALKRPVHQGGHRIAHESPPIFAVEVPGEPIQGECRTGGHRQHIAIARVHHHHGARVSRHGLFGRLLDPPVDAGDHLAAGVGLVALHDLDRPPEGIDLDAFAPIPAAQVLVQQPLQTGLPDHVAAPVAPLLHLLLAHLADVSEQVGGEGAGGIDALGLDLDDHARQLELPLLDLRDLCERQPAAHPDGPERIRGNPIERLPELGERDLEQDR